MWVQLIVWIAWVVVMGVTRRGYSDSRLKFDREHVAGWVFTQKSDKVN